MKLSILILFLLLVPAVLACPNMSTGFVEGRYRDDTIDGLVVACDGTAASACNYHINDFANVTFANCSSASINAELGWNRISICGTNGSVWNCTNHTFWAKKLSGGTSADYSVMIVTFMMGLALFFLGGFLQARLFVFMAGVAGLVLGYEMLAFSMFAGFSVIVCSALFSLAVLFRRGDER